MIRISKLYVRNKLYIIYYIDKFYDVSILRYILYSAAKRFYFVNSFKRINKYYSWIYFNKYIAI